PPADAGGHGGPHRDAVPPGRGGRALSGALPGGAGEVRRVDEAAIASAAAARFRSEYDYAVFEYLRSAKVIQALERAGARLGGRVLDAGCGGGGTALSLAEESAVAVGLDLEARVRYAGPRLAAGKEVANAAFDQGDSGRC